MANEAQIIDQPDALPGGATTGYVRQNTNAEAARNGDDTTAPFAASATTVTIPAGGVVDVNGVLYSIISDATLTLAAADTDYYIYLAAGTGTSLTPTITTSSGTFDATKNGRYISGERVLDWVFRRDSSAVYVGKMQDKSVPTFVDQDLRRDNQFISEGINTGTTDGADNKNIIVASAGAIGIARGAYLDMKGNESPTAPGSILMVPGNTSTSFTRIYAEDGGVDKLAFQIDNASGIQNNLPLLPTTSPTSGSQSVGAGASVTLTRGVWNIATLSLDVLVQIQVSGTWYSLGQITTITGHGVFSDGTNVRVINLDTLSQTYYYQKY